MSHAWNSMFEMFIAKYMPCMDENLKYANLIAVLQSNLYVGTQFELCFNFSIALENSKLFHMNKNEVMVKQDYKSSPPSETMPCLKKYFLNIFEKVQFLSGSLITSWIGKNNMIQMMNHIHTEI
jgi:hypothetical protein